MLKKDAGVILYFFSFKTFYYNKTLFVLFLSLILWIINLFHSTLVFHSHIFLSMFPLREKLLNWLKTVSIILCFNIINILKKLVFNLVNKKTYFFLQMFHRDFRVQFFSYNIMLWLSSDVDLFSEQHQFTQTRFFTY